MKTINHPPYIATEIYDNVWSIDQQDMVRCFLILGSHTALLIDSCAEQAPLNELVAAITTLPVKLVHTHCDPDHTAASNLFEDLYMHPSEFGLMRSKWDVGINPKAVREGEVFELGGRQLEVVLIPGHTPGSIALLDRQNKILIIGDSVSAANIYMFGPGRNMAAYIDSMQRIYNMRDAYDMILPSHGRMPLGAEVIPQLIATAQKLMQGELQGKDDGSGLPCLLYIDGRSRFYY